VLFEYEIARLQLPLYPSAPYIEKKNKSEELNENDLYIHTNYFCVKGQLQQALKKTR
jgi:hypothetical protein